MLGGGRNERPVVQNDDTAPTEPTKIYNKSAAQGPGINLINKLNPMQVKPEVKNEKKSDDQIESFISYDLPPAVLQANNKNNSFTESQFSQDDACPVPNDSPGRALTLKAANSIDPFPTNQPVLERIEENEEG